MKSTQHSTHNTQLIPPGYKQTEVADHLGITDAAVCQRRKRAEREWYTYQGERQPSGLRLANHAAAISCPGGVIHPTTRPAVAQPHAWRAQSA